MPGTVPTNCTTLDCVVGERILTVTLNRPEELNSFTPTMARELARSSNRRAWTIRSAPSS